LLVAASTLVACHGPRANEAPSVGAAANDSGSDASDAALPTTNTKADAGPTCPALTAQEFCANDWRHCPASASDTDVCAWILRVGLDPHFGRLECAQGGIRGVSLNVGSTNRSYLFDEQGIAMVTENAGPPDYALQCVAGGGVKTGTCRELLALYGCVLPPGPP
jgi:hypothetical protein